MNISSIESFGAAELLARLRRTRLRGHGRPELYADATLDLVSGVDPGTLAPAQNYVLAPQIRTVLALRAALLPHGHDVLALDGGLWIRTADAPGERVPVLPPIVEESVEADGRTVLLVNDGMHRIAAARRLGTGVSVVLARGVPPEYPYYALPLPGGWPAVTEFEELPDGHQKKAYRQPQGYKALFRDFGALFPGVQQDRRPTNPDHLVG